MNHTLNLSELDALIKAELFKSDSYNPEFNYLKEFFEDAHYWDRSITSINHILSRLLEKLDSEQCESTLEFIYSLIDKCYFIIQEGTVEFIDELFKNDFNPLLSLEEELIIAQNRL